MIEQLFNELINNLIPIYEKKKNIYNKLFIKRFINYFTLAFSQHSFNSLTDIKNNNSFINYNYINNDDILFFNNFISNNFTLSNKNELNEFILLNTIKDKINTKNISQFINDINSYIITPIFIKKIDDFFDNYETLLCSSFKTSYSFNGPFFTILKLNNDSIINILSILDSYKLKKK